METGYPRRRGQGRRGAAAVGALPWSDRLVGAALLIAVAVLHVVAFPDHVKIAPYIGVSFLLNAGAASVLAAAILSGRAWGWSLGSLLAAVTAVLYVAARTIGLPGYHEADWIDPVGLFPVGLASFMVEALVVIAFLLVARRQTRDRRLVRPEPSP